VATLACEPCAVAFDGGAFEAALFPPPQAAARPRTVTIAANATARIATLPCQAERVKLFAYQTSIQQLSAVSENTNGKAVKADGEGNWTLTIQ
jgi:hypothetical protein